MSTFQSIVERELGLRRPIYYDSILSRLVVNRTDLYLGISPNVSRADYHPFPPLFACKFAETQNYEHVIALANEDGRVAIQDTLMSPNEQQHSAFQGVQCHLNAIFDLSWMPGSMKFVTASGDHTAKLWDVNSESILNVRSFENHTKSVRTVVFRPEDPFVFASGARDGRVLLWDTRVKSSVTRITKPDDSINNCHPLVAPKTPGSSSKKYSKITDRTNSVTGLIFQDEHNLISCGATDGSIRVWDLRRNYSSCKRDPLPKHSIPYCGISNKNGYSNLVLDKSRFKLFANCMDGVIYCFNLSTYSIIPEQKYTGYDNGSFYIKSSLSPDCKYFVSGSSDFNAYIWNVKYRDPIIKLQGHEAEVTCAAWCQVGDIKIVTCSDDSRHKIWRIGKESYERYEEEDVCGRSCEILSTDRIHKSHWSTLDKTPQSTKRKMSESSSSSTCKKLCLQENENSTLRHRRKSKRSLLEMLNNSLPPLSEENNKSSPKKINIELASNILTSDCDYVASSSAATFAYYSVEDENLMKNSELITPTKALITGSPNYQNSPHLFNSPTMNLPNFVSDGKAPHLSSTLTQKRSKKVDWLTKLARDKLNKQQPQHGSPKQNADSLFARNKSKADKTLLHFFTSVLTVSTDRPLADKTNTLEISPKRKGDKLEDDIPTKQPNLQINGCSVMEIDDQKKIENTCKVNKSLLSYFNTKTVSENNI